MTFQASVRFGVLTICSIALIGHLFSARPSAQNGSQFRDWTSFSDGAVAAPPKMDCRALVSLTGYQFSIETAVLVPATADLPEHCRVTGQILPEVRFEVALPTAWKGRLYMFGNGGYAGEALTAPARINTRNLALRQGFVVGQNNTGHDAAIEPLATFALNRQKLLDYAYRAVHVTAETSKELIRRYYGNDPAKSYFDGCSTGGRQGLMSAQRFPADFDGIAVGAPVLNFTDTMISYISDLRALETGAFPPDKVKLLAERVVAKCDPVDGLVDGLVDDPRRCAFNPRTDLPICGGSGASSDCFSPGQVQALEAIYRGARAGERQLFFGRPLLTEVGGPYQFAPDFFRYMAFGKPDPHYEAIKSLNFETDVQRLAEIRNLVNATDADLTRFKARGGKIIMYFGWVDASLNPLMGVDYYHGVQKHFATSTSEFFKLYMVPGMFHCRGGPGPSVFDAFTPLVNWVEKGKSPAEIIASQAPGAAARTRPLCPYPEVAKYNGRGSIDDAANFACRSPEPTSTRP